MGVRFVNELRYEYSPPHPESRLDHMGTYRRTLPVNLDRMYENALDWEHLPYLHGSSFSAIKCIDAGSWGWRCEVVDLKGRASILELALDRSCRRWITRNIEGPSRGAEIWTHVFVTTPNQMDIVIDYFVPDVPPESRQKVGMAYARSYEMLYDEDVLMMTERQKMLDRRTDAIVRDDEVTLTIDDERPFKTSLSGRDFYVDCLEGEWIAYPQTCPHQMGPLTEGVDVNGTVTCPWHGYVFDVRTGECVSGHTCRFGRLPVVKQAGDQITLCWVTD